MACPQEDSAPTGGIQGSLRNKTAPACKARRVFYQQLWPQPQENRVVTYRRKKQRMPPPHQGQEGAAKRRADVEPHAGGGGEGGNQRRQQRPQGAHSGGLPAAEPGVRQGRRAVCQQAAQQIGQQAAKTGGSGGREKKNRAVGVAAVRVSTSVRSRANTRPPTARDPSTRVRR